MVSKHRIIIFIDWFYPAYKAGGPVKSVLNIINSLSQDLDIKVVTSNKDVDGTILSVSSNTWVNKEGYSICYLHDQMSVLDFLKQEQLSCDSVYFNSLFSIKYTILPLLFYRNSKVKKILAPRGMLGQGALEIKSIKKKLFLFLSKKFLFADVIWHASTPTEANEVKQVIGRTAETIVAQNISSPATERIIASDFKMEQKLRLVFISRISSKKNLYFLLELLKLMEDLSDVTLDIYGPIEDQEYWNTCYALVEKDKRVQYKGVITPVEINSVLSSYHFFVLPTLHENYGHSIVEALNCGLPVVLSQHTPWRNLKSENVGFDIALSDKQAWMDALRAAYFMNGSEYKTMTMACYEYAKKYVVNEQVVIENKKLFYGR